MRTALPERVRPVTTRHDRARLLLAAAWLVGLLVAAVLLEHRATLGDLEAAVRAGAVSSVHVYGEGLPPDSTGWATQQVRWQEGGRRHGLEVLHLVQDDGADRPRREGWAISPVEVGERLQALAAGLDVRRSTRLASSAELGPLVVPEALAIVLLLGWLAALALLVGGPEPLRATRWAWCWLLMVPLVGAPAFLLLSGPTPGLPRPAPGRARLTGGWAFLLSVVLVPGARG